MNNLSIKIVSVLVILLFCLSPLGAIDFNQTNITKEKHTDDNMLIRYENANGSSGIKVADETGDAGSAIEKIVNHTFYGSGDDAKKNNSKNQLSKDSPNLRACINNIKYGEVPIVQVYCDVRLHARIAMECPDFENEYKMPIEDGYLYYQFHEYNLKPRVYHVKISTIGDKQFDAQEIEVMFSVSDKKDPGLNVSVDDVYLCNHQNPVVHVKANNYLSGEAKLKLFCNNSYLYNDTIKIVNGVGNITLDKEIYAGHYSAIVTFDGDATFKDSEKSANFTVHDKYNLGLSVSVDDVTVGENPIVHVKANESFNDYVDINLKSNNIIIDRAKFKLIDGVAYWTVEDDLSPGNYSVLISFNGDDTFNRDEKSTNFTVKKYDPGLSVRVDNVYHGEKPVVKILANDSLNGTVDIKLKFKGSDFIIASSKLKLDRGMGNLTIGTILPQGDYSLFVTFIGDATFDSAEKSADFSVK